MSFPGPTPPQRAVGLTNLLFASPWHSHSWLCSFDHTYLTQYAKNLEAENISMRLFPLSMCEAVLFDSFRYRHLLMPLRT